jgi:hypothetical protein
MPAVEHPRRGLRRDLGVRVIHINRGANAPIASGQALATPEDQTKRVVAVDNNRRDRQPRANNPMQILIVRWSLSAGPPSMTGTAQLVRLNEHVLLRNSCGSQIVTCANESPCAFLDQRPAVGEPLPLLHFFRTFLPRNR